MGATVASLAGATELGPDWGDGAPLRRPAERDEPSIIPVLPGRRCCTTPPTGPSGRCSAGRYITPEGRVIDTGNGNVSHSEGQGWGLMAAQACDDQASFARILAWTTQNLQRRPFDCLHAWRYRPGEANPVADLNNATDGDLFIAAALARAAVRWRRPDYAVAAERLARAILGLVRQAGARTVLLPGAYGFETGSAYTINLSLLCLRPVQRPCGAGALVDLGPVAARRVGAGAAGALRPLEPAAGLVAGQPGGCGLSIAEAWPARFSYDAIRVPLHLVWGTDGRGAAVRGVRAVLDGAAPDAARLGGPDQRRGRGLPRRRRGYGRLPRSLR